MEISIILIRRSRNRLIFLIEISISGKTALYRDGPNAVPFLIWRCRLTIGNHSMGKALCRLTGIGNSVEEMKQSTVLPPQTHSRTIQDSKVHVAHMGPTWALSVPSGPHVGPMNLAIRDASRFTQARCRPFRACSSDDRITSDNRSMLLLNWVIALVL